MWSALGLLIVVGLVVVLVMMTGSPPGGTGWARLVYLVMLLAFVGMGMGTAFAHNPGKSLRYIGIWVAIAAGFALLYSFQNEFTTVYDNVSGQADPRGARMAGEAVIIQAGPGGHFRVRVDVEGETIPFMVDTGASDVTLSPGAAEALGMNLDSLSYSKIYSTANGMVRGAPITLATMSIGDITLRNVKASVNQADLGISLLGLSFLARLSGYEVRGDELILYP
jgi:aspartyl protease family protein